MNLPPPGEKYDANNEAQMRAILEREDARNHKKGEAIEVGANVPLILTDTATGTRYSLTVVSGVLTLAAL